MFNKLLSVSLFYPRNLHSQDLHTQKEGTCFVVSLLTFFARVPDYAYRPGLEALCKRCDDFDTNRTSSADYNAFVVKAKHILGEDLYKQLAKTVSWKTFVSGLFRVFFYHDFIQNVLQKPLPVNAADETPLTPAEFLSRLSAVELSLSSLKTFLKTETHNVGVAQENLYVSLGFQKIPIDHIDHIDLVKFAKQHRGLIVQGEVALLDSDDDDRYDFVADLSSSGQRALIDSTEFFSTQAHSVCVSLDKNTRHPSALKVLDSNSEHPYWLAPDVPNDLNIYAIWYYPPLDNLYATLVRAYGEPNLLSPPSHFSSYGRHLSRNASSGTASSDGFDGVVSVTGLQTESEQYFTQQMTLHNTPSATHENPLKNRQDALYNLFRFVFNNEDVLQPFQKQQFVALIFDEISQDGLRDMAVEILHIMVQQRLSFQTLLSAPDKIEALGLCLPESNQDPFLPRHHTIVTVFSLLSQSSGTFKAIFDEFHAYDRLLMIADRFSDDPTHETGNLASRILKAVNPPHFCG